MDAMAVMLVIGVVIGMSVSAKEESIGGALATGIITGIGLFSFIVAERMGVSGIMFLFALVGIAGGVVVASIVAFTIGVIVWGLLMTAKDVAGRSWGWAKAKIA